MQSKAPTPKILFSRKVLNVIFVVFIKFKLNGPLYFLDNKKGIWLWTR